MTTSELWLSTNDNPANKVRIAFGIQTGRTRVSGISSQAKSPPP